MRRKYQPDKKCEDRKDVYNFIYRGLIQYSPCNQQEVTIEKNTAASILYNSLNVKILIIWFLRTSKETSERCKNCPLEYNTSQPREGEFEFQTNHLGVAM